MNKNFQSTIAFDYPNYQEYSPVAKLVLKDSSYLSKLELISVILGKKDIKAVGPLLAACDNSLDNLSKIPIGELAKIPGIGVYKASVIIAAFELSKRLIAEKSIPKVSVKSSLDIFDYMSPVFSDLQYEEFWILYLNHGHKIIQAYKNSQGGINQTTVDVRLIIKKALELCSTVICISHNHPSGNINPSNEDIKITKTIKDAARLMDITTLDHVIIADTKYYSFADEGIL